MTSGDGGDGVDGVKTSGEILQELVPFRNQLDEGPETTDAEYESLTACWRRI